jgi:hypothetical protein
MSVVYMAPSLWPLVIAAWTETGITFLIIKGIAEIIGEMLLESLSLFIVLYENFLNFMVLLGFYLIGNTFSSMQG